MKAKLEAKVEMEKRDKRSKAKKWVYLLFPTLLSLVALSLEPRALKGRKGGKRGDGGEYKRVVLIVGILVCYHLGKLKKARKLVHRKSKRGKERD